MSLEKTHKKSSNKIISKCPNSISKCPNSSPQLQGNHSAVRLYH